MDPVQLLEYYNKFFPHQLIHNWINYKDGGANCFKFREFSFTLTGDIYQRYIAFDNSLEFRNALLQKCPIKIDIGAIYNMSPRVARTYPNDFKPQQHELVFDIDISDYDDVRTCCKESNICEKCWPFMKIGAKVLYRALTHDFGFKHILFVYSGRRGFHCWVCDKEARTLDSEGRKCIADYFSIVVGGQSMVKRVTLNPAAPIYPMISQALDVIDEDFDDLMIDKQDFLANEHLVQNVIDLCEDASLRDLKKRLYDKCKMHHYSSRDCWNIMKTLSDSFKGKRYKMNYFIQEVKLQHCFPRLDINVTKGFNHLLKLPFCIHPKTENVCVPFDIHKIDEFQLKNVPTLKTLTRESMDPYIKIMKEFLDRLERQ